jgi:ferredoxin
MAVLGNRFTENVVGRYYVDDQCIDCDQCRETAPNIFRRDDATGHSFVFHQPETSEGERTRSRLVTIRFMVWVRQCGHAMERLLIEWGAR